MKKALYILVFIVLFIVLIYQGLMIFIEWMIINTILQLMDICTAFASLV